MSTAPTSADPRPDVRPAPIITLLPAGRGISPFSYGALSFVVGVTPCFGTSAILSAREHNPRFEVVSLGFGLLYGCLFGVIMWRRGVRRRAIADEWQKRFGQRFSDWARDPVAAELVLRSSSAFQPSTTTVIKAVGTLSTAPAARIICLGPVGIPEGGDFRFEPVILTPLSLGWRELVATVFALALGIGWMCFPRVLLADLVVIGNVIGLAGLCMWRLIIRPRYIRLAPGMVQIIRYRLSRTKPRVRSYPIAPGTLVVARQSPYDRQPLTVHVRRGDMRDDLQLWKMRKAEHAMQHIWRALLSTAPTPPLSDEQLVG